MTQYGEIEGSEATWLQPGSFERRFELRAGETRVAVLAFRSPWGTLALAETSQGKWTFKRVGFLSPRITIRPEGGDVDLAVYRPTNLWGHGILAFKIGPSFDWKPINFWATVWAFSDITGQPVVRFGPEVRTNKLTDILKTQVAVEIEPSAPRDETLPVLLTLGMYLLILRHEDSAATLAATTAVT